MKGRIKRFIEDKGYGFITGEDGQDYFFHISQVRDMVEIKKCMIVEFDVADGKRGKNAVNIRVTEQNNSPSKFITCGNTNIRLNNITQYGFGEYPVLYEKVFRKITVYDATTWAAVFFIEKKRNLSLRAGIVIEQFQKMKLIILLMTMGLFGIGFLGLKRMTPATFWHV